MNAEMGFRSFRLKVDILLRGIKSWEYDSYIKILIQLMPSTRKELRDLAERLDLTKDVNNSLLLSLSKNEIKKQVKNLQSLLAKGSFFEQKSFIRSFIKKITFIGATITIEYTVPLKTNKAETPSNTKEVLPTSYIG